MIIGISGKIGSGKDTVGNIINWAISVHKNSSYNNDVWYCDSSAHFEIKKFADKLKDIVCLLINCTREQLEDREFKEKELGEEWWLWKSYDNNTLFSYTGQTMDIKYWEIIKLTPRLLLQLIGTECGRDIIHPNIWVNALMSEYKPLDAPYKSLGDLLEDKHNGLLNSPNWIITDMRFPNELKAVKDRKGISIRINRVLSLSDSTKSFAEDQAIIEENFNTKSGKFHPSETALDNAEFDYTIDNNGTIENLIQEVKLILTNENII